MNEKDYLEMLTKLTFLVLTAAENPITKNIFAARDYAKVIHENVLNKGEES